MIQFFLVFAVVLVPSLVLTNLLCWRFIWRTGTHADDPFNWRALVWPGLYTNWLRRR